MTRPPSHRFDFYGYDLWLAITDDQWQYLRRKFGKKALPKDPDAAGRTDRLEHTTDRRQVFIVWIDLATVGTGRHLVDTCAHEANHVVRGLLNVDGETARLEEVDSYMVGWVAAWLWAHATDTDT